MKVKMIIAAIILAHTCPAHSCLAQGARALRCPTSKKERTFVPKPPGYLDISAGATHSFMYRKAKDNIGKPFKFASKPAFFLSVMEHCVVSQKLELLAGLEFTQSIQGLKMKLTENGSDVSDSRYYGSLIARLPLGLSYVIRTGWRVSITPYAAYTTLWSTIYSGKGPASGGSAGISYVSWQEQSSFDKFFFGTTLSTRINITNKLSTNILGSIDFDSAIPTTGTIDLSQNGRTETYTGRAEPYLFYAGITLSYGIWQQDRSKY